MNNNYKLLKNIRFESKNKLKSEQVIYSNKEWKFKTIVSNLTHNCLIDDNKFPEWDNWSNLVIDDYSHLKRKEKMQINTCITGDTKFRFIKAQILKLC